MFLKKWDDLPNNIKNEYTYNYYQKLEKKKINLILKRIFDISFSLILLIILSPILIILSICIKIDSRGPIFYRQERVTQYDKTFRIFKFRTMVQDADKIGALVTINRDPRITRVGNLIRKFRLDEIPQLINILIGDMSFVGTRPEVRKYVENYTDEMKATLLMPAGVTSYASIKFKDEDEILEKYVQKVIEKKPVLARTTPYEDIKNSEKNIDVHKSIDEVYIKKILPQKMKYNLRYIENFNILNDLKICIETVIGVLK